MPQPLRMCVGCRTHRAKNELVRIVRTPQGTAVLDRDGRAQGRGAYLCADAACLRRAQKSGALGRNLGVAVSEEVMQQLEAEIAKTQG